MIYACLISSTAAIPHPSSDRFAARPTASGDMRSSLIVPANNSITIIPPTTPHNPISLFPAARFSSTLPQPRPDITCLVGVMSWSWRVVVTLFSPTKKKTIPFSNSNSSLQLIIRFHRGSNLCVLCVLCVKYNCEYYRIRSRGKGNFVSLSCTRLVAWLFHRWRFAYPDFSHASPVF